MSSTTLAIANREWATRPDDQRFLSLQDLGDYVRERKEQSEEWDTILDNVEVTSFTYPRLLSFSRGGYDFTNYAFTQFATLVGAPPTYLRGLSPGLVEQNLNYGINENGEKPVKLLVSGEDFRAVTSPTYGRIWDQEVVDLAQSINYNDRWKVPSATYSDTDPLRATTLYGSDRDTFMFLVDPEQAITVGEVELHRGFIMWNSEVGARRFGLMTFLYERVCDNRIIWGAKDVSQILIRHTKGAPDRFAKDISSTLRAYAESGGDEYSQVVQDAQKYVFAAAEMEPWLTARGFTEKEAIQSLDLAFSGEAGPGRPDSLWGAVQGLTKYAQSLPFNEDRFALELRAGKLLDLVAA